MVRTSQATHLPITPPSSAGSWFALQAREPANQVRTLVRDSARTSSNHPETEGNETDAAIKPKPKARILSRRGTRTCDQHQWETPWPAAVVRQCAHCHAWIVPPL